MAIKRLSDSDGPYIFAGALPPRVTGLVLEWAAIHRGELLEDWRRAQNQEPLTSVEPLT